MKGSRKYLNLLKSVILLALVVAVSMIPVSASAAALRADIVKCDPNPAEIGQYVKVWIKIENIGNAKAEDVSVKLIPEYPFSLDNRDDTIRNIGILSPDRHASLEYYLYVDENARPGTRSIKVQYQDTEGTAWNEETLDIWVGSGSDTFDSKGTIQLEQIKTEPEVFMQGDTGTVTFTLKNTATQYSLSLGDKVYDTNARIRSVTLKGTDDIKVNNGKYQDTGILGPGDTVDLTYNVKVDDAARDGTKHLELIVVGSSHTYNYNLDVPIRVDSAGIKVIPTKPLMVDGDASTIEFDVVNTHPNTLTSVSIQPYAEGIEFSPVEYFIGTMDPDELFTVEFDARPVSDDVSGQQNLTLLAQYRSGFNHHDTKLNDLILAIDAGNTNNGPGFAGIGALLAILVISSLVMYKRKKHP